MKELEILKSELDNEFTKEILKITNHMKVHYLSGISEMKKLRFSIHY